MAYIEINQPDPNSPDKKLGFYLDDKLKLKLETKLVPNVSKKDEDAVIVVDGNERTGKSVFTMQLAKFLDHDFNLSQLCFKPEDFRNAILNAKKNQCIVFDEGYRGFSSRNTLSEVNSILTSLMMEMGMKNLYIIVVLPTFYMLDRYVALFRAIGLFHVYKRKGNKGHWRYYNRKKKALLYNNPKYKKEYAYPPISKFRGKFYNKYIIDEIEYRNKKAISFKDFKRVTKSEKYIEQRNKLIYALNKEEAYNLKMIADLCVKYKINLKMTVISEILNRFKSGLPEDEE